MNSSDLVIFPKVQLHEHLDGGLRPQTMIELADEVGYAALPSTDAATLAHWFHQTVKVGGLPGYLATFEHTISVLQTPDAIERVAYESALDLSDDGVIHAEVRFAPELNTRSGLSLDDVIEASLAGFVRGSRERDIEVGLIVDGMRQEHRTLEAARAAVRWRDQGVVGFDIAGPEAGFPPADHLEAFEVARAGGLGITIHAGEAHGLSSIAEAIHTCGADRIGHGVRIVDDIEGGRLGPLAAEIRERGVALEMCPRSNVDTGAVAGLADHPIDRLHQLGFTVTVNCDNRLMSDTSPVSELQNLMETFGWGVDEVRAVNRNAAEVVFASDARRRELVGRIDGHPVTPNRA
ncbi:MAG: adenosine deaminase [Acidimicrobiia bacterium]